MADQELKYVIRAFWFWFYYYYYYFECTYSSKGEDKYYFHRVFLCFYALNSIGYLVVINFTLCPADGMRRAAAER